MVLDILVEMVVLVYRRLEPGAELFACGCGETSNRSVTGNALMLRCCLVDATSKLSTAARFELALLPHEKTALSFELNAH